MTKRLWISAALLLFVCIVAKSQEGKIAVFGSPAPTERAETRVVFWDSAKQGAAGEVAIMYGQPDWKKEYDSPIFDTMTKGKVWRFGKNFWTTLDTNLTLKIGDTTIPAGSYYLGLHRSDDGAMWSLAFFDQAKVRAAKMDAFEAPKAQVAFKTPIKFEKVTESAAKLVILLSGDKNNLKEIGLKIHWGTMHLSTPIQVVW